MRKEKTELVKMQDVREDSQAIGEFLDWLFNSKEYMIARHLTDEEEEEGDLEEDALIRIHINIEGILAEYFKIDLVQAEKERCELLESIRN